MHEIGEGKNGFLGPAIDKKRVMDPPFVKLSKRVHTISGAVLAPGFHFCPNDYDLLTYLKNKNNEQDLDIVDQVITEIDVYSYKDLPGDLLNKYLPFNEQELYFFCPIKKKYGGGSKINRSTAKGNWRITGEDRKINDMMMRTLVFYDKKRKKKNWMMYEYRLKGSELSQMKQTIDSRMEKVSYVLCKLFEKRKANLKDVDQPECCFVKNKREESSSTDEIVIVPSSHIQKLSELKCEISNTSVLDESLMTSADDNNNTCNVLECTYKGDLGAPDGVWLSDFIDDGIISMNYFENGVCGSENTGNGLQNTHDAAEGLASVEKNESINLLYLQHESIFSEEQQSIHIQKVLDAQPANILHMLTHSQEETDGASSLGAKSNTSLNSQYVEKKLMNFQSGDMNDNSYLHEGCTSGKMDAFAIGNGNSKRQALYDDTKVELDPFPDTLWPICGMQSPDIDLTDWEIFFQC